MKVKVTIRRSPDPNVTIKKEDVVLKIDGKTKELKRWEWNPNTCSYDIEY